jgi:signal transduction histidine kinase
MVIKRVNFLLDTPIRRKIITIVMIICSTVMLIAYCIIAYSQWQSRHQLLRNSVSTLTRVIGINCGASLAFHDAETGEEILSALKSEKQVVSAELFTPDGKKFASYQTHYAIPQNLLNRIINNPIIDFYLFLPKQQNELEQLVYGKGFLEVTQKILAGTRIVGSIRLRVSLLELYENFTKQALLMAGVLGAMLIVAFLLARTMQKLISRPVLHLAGVVKSVANSKDYNLRATAEGNDELGDLIKGFNTMLETIQQHDEKLTMANQGLSFARKEAELAKNIAEQANQSKSEFLANMSHELRTPMHAILSFSKFGIKNLEKAPLQKLGGYFQRIQDSGNRLMVLLNDLLDLAKLEAGRMQYTFSKADLASTLDNCCRELEAHIQEQGVAIHIAPLQCETIGFFDPLRISQVITNLLSNAIKFTPEGKAIFLSIVEDKLPSGQRKEDKGSCRALHLEVRDEGIGIPENEFEDVFNKFIQSSKTKSGAGGTGLGLAISKEIIEAHRGRIWAENSVDGGAVFSFTIPVHQDAFTNKG